MRVSIVDNFEQVLMTKLLKVTLDITITYFRHVVKILYKNIKMAITFV